MKQIGVIILVIILYNVLPIRCQIFSWNVVQYEWLDENLKKTALKNKAYIPENNLPFGIARWRNKLFVTVNRWKNGVASTLNYIDLDLNKCVNSPLLVPYPSWETNLIVDESTISDDPLKKPIVSVFRVWVDNICDRLWVPDNGFDDFFGSERKVVDKSLLIFDLKENKLIRRYYFKKTDIKENSAYGNIVVEVKPDSCDEAFAYIADFTEFAIVVYDFKRNTSWRIKHLYFYPEPHSGEFYIGGVMSHWIDGVLGLGLSNIQEDGHRYLYFYSLSGISQYKVSTDVLKNHTWATSEPGFHDFKYIGTRQKKSQSTVCYYDDVTSVIFFTQVNKNGLLCWNSKKPLDLSNTHIVAQDDINLEFPCDMKIDQNRNLWVISNRLSRYLYGSHDPTEINVRIFEMPVNKLVQDTVCATQ